MIYIFIDESGDTGNPSIIGTTNSFSMCAVICYIENIEFLSNEIKKLVIDLKKKEVKYSKLSDRQKILVGKYFSKLEIEKICTYENKKSNSYNENLLKTSFENLLREIKIDKIIKLKFVVDGDENAYYRKTYTKIIEKYFTNFTLKFGNSIKTPMLQVADFYAGEIRFKNKDLEYLK